MAVDLQRKVGPLPLWGWVAITGGGIGIILLTKRAKAKEPANESEPIPGSLASPFGPEAGGAGTTGVGVQPNPEVAKAPEPQLIAQVSPERTPVSEFLQTEAELEAGGYHRGGEPAPAPPPANPASSAHATQAARINSAGGNPRKGLAYKVGKYKGMAAHIYQHAVHGGVGPHHNIIVLGGPRGGKTHAAKPSHAPAHAKPKPKPKHHHPPKPKHHNAKPVRRHAAKPRRRAPHR